ncbi:hypothetical protein Droror1_Dr00001091 [Drosera rotundifolia]
MSISTLIEGANFFCRLTIELTLGIAWHNDALNQIDTYYGSVPSCRSAILEESNHPREVKSPNQIRPNFFCQIKPLRRTLLLLLPPSPPSPSSRLSPVPISGHPLFVFAQLDDGTWGKSGSGGGSRCRGRGRKKVRVSETVRFNEFESLYEDFSKDFAGFKSGGADWGLIEQRGFDWALELLKTRRDDYGLIIASLLVCFESGKLLVEYWESTP